MIRGQPGYFPLHLNGRLLGRNIEGKKSQTGGRKIEVRKVIMVLEEWFKGWFNQILKKAHCLTYHWWYLIMLLVLSFQVSKICSPEVFCYNATTMEECKVHSWFSRHCLNNTHHPAILWGCNLYCNVLGEGLRACRKVISFYHKHYSDWELVICQAENDCFVYLCVRIMMIGSSCWQGLWANSITPPFKHTHAHLFQWHC